VYEIVNLRHSFPYRMLIVLNKNKEKMISIIFDFLIGFTVLIASIFNLAHADHQCVGQKIDFCNQSTTQSSCVNTYSQTNLTNQCVWNGNSCLVSSAACYASASIHGKP